MVEPSVLLPQRFYARDARVVARELIGKVLRREGVALRITETEAYRPDDSACHARFGRTARTETLFGPPGRAYVYLCYGLHHLFNVVADEEGVGSAVLVRAAEPLAGLDIVRARRGGKSGPQLLTGPGKVSAALDLDRSFDKHSLFEPGGLELLDGPLPARLLVGPRVGIDYADARHRNAPWRFAAADTRWVTARATLRPLGAIR
jgi:DNA-3-methyladenine glycosylase